MRLGSHARPLLVKIRGNSSSFSPVLGKVSGLAPLPLMWVGTEGRREGGKDRGRETQR